MAEESPPPEDSLRHLRCRGMTSQGFPLEMPILKRNSKFKIQNYDDKIVVSSSRLGKVSKLPLLSLRSVGSKFKIDFSARHSTFWNEVRK